MYSFIIFENICFHPYIQTPAKPPLIKSPIILKKLLLVSRYERRFPNAITLNQCNPEESHTETPQQKGLGWHDGLCFLLGCDYITYQYYIIILCIWNKVEPWYLIKFVMGPRVLSKVGKRVQLTSIYNHISKSQKLQTVGKHIKLPI